MILPEKFEQMFDQAFANALQRGHENNPCTLFFSETLAVDSWIKMKNKLNLQQDQALSELLLVR